MGAFFDAWRARGGLVTVRGHKVFCVDTGAPGGRSEKGDGRDHSRDPCLVILHGFPTSSLDFHRAIDALAARFRVILHDHPGFGFSDKPAEYSYSLLDQAEVAFELWHELGVDSAHLMAHDYGTSVATELLARRERGGIPVELESVTLMNGSMLLELAHLRLSQRILRSPRWGPLLARTATRWYFHRVMRRLWGSPRRVERADLDDMWDGMRLHDGHLRAPQISEYLDERVRFRRRWIGALQRLDIPVHLLWGRRDPIAVPAIPEQLAEEIPDVRLSWLDELGHYPMLEDPDTWSSAALDFLT